MPTILTIVLLAAQATTLPAPINPRNFFKFYEEVMLSGQEQSSGRIKVHFGHTDEHPDGFIREPSCTFNDTTNYKENSKIEFIAHDTEGFELKVTKGHLVSWSCKGIVKRLHPITR